jgi:tRNA G18 (ribose-2'-O)-methylase SpoU
MNVHDHLKDSSVEEIKNYYFNSAMPAALAMFNVGYDYNIASVIRTANCFGFKEVYHIQKEGKRIDKRGTVGADHYTKLIHCYTENEFFDKIKDYIPVAVENNINFVTKNALEYVPLRRTCFIFGAENAGLEMSVLSKSQEIITIPNFGCIRSLNVGATAAIIASIYRKYHN